MTWSPETLPPPGWYPDPAGQPAARWWDGGRWTPAVAWYAPTARATATAPRRTGYPPAPGYPPVAGPAGVGRRGGEDPRPLPARAAWLGVAGVVVGFLASGILQVAGAAVLPGSSAAQLLLGEMGLWFGLGGTCLVASRRFGSGSVVRDFGLRFRLIDLAYGPIAALACVFAAGFVGAAFHGSQFAGSNTNIITSQQGNTTGVAIVTVIASIGAPVFEELFFRGFLRLSLASRLGVGAIWVQAMFFGLAHYQFGLGLRNVSVFCATAGIGVVLGYTAHLNRRLGPGMVAHGLFNLFVTLTIIGVIR